MHSVNRKLFWLALCVIGFAVFMTGLLLYFKYQSVYTGLQRDRVILVAGEVDDIVEKSLSLGQDFREIAALQEVIERQGKADPIFLGIEVADRDGRIVYATDTARVGASLPAPWLTAFSRQTKSGSLLASPDEAVVAAVIRNGFAQVAGYAVIRYDRHLEQQAMSAFTQRLWIACITLFALFTALLYTTLRWLWQRTDRELVLAAEALSDADQPHSHALAADVAAIKAQIGAARQQLAAISPQGGQ